MALHLTPEALYPVELRTVGLIEDELDAVLLSELLRLLSLVDAAVVHEDVPSLTCPTESSVHHRLELSEELDERLLCCCSPCLS